jgi:hypothetical protein
MSDALRTLPTPADSYSSTAGTTVANELARREAEGSARWGVLSSGLLSPLSPVCCSQVGENNSVTLLLWFEPRAYNGMACTVDCRHMLSDTLILS